MQNQDINQAAAAPTEYAGFFIRLCAFILDMLIVNAVLIPFRVIVWIMGTVLPVGFLNTGILFGYTCVDIFCYLCTVSYFTIMTYKTGTTLGKRIANVHVISVRGTSWNLTDILYRETIGRFLSSILFIGYLLAAADSEKATLHDRLCKTRVVFRTSPDAAPGPVEEPRPVEDPESIEEPGTPEIKNDIVNETAD